MALQNPQQSKYGIVNGIEHWDAHARPLNKKLREATSPAALKAAGQLQMAPQPYEPRELLAARQLQNAMSGSEGAGVNISQSAELGQAIAEKYGKFGVNRQFHDLGFGVGPRHETLLRHYPGYNFHDHLTGKQIGVGHELREKRVTGHINSPGPIYFSKEGTVGHKHACGQYVSYPQFRIPGAPASKNVGFGGKAGGASGAGAATDAHKLRSNANGSTDKASLAA